MLRLVALFDATPREAALLAEAAGAPVGVHPSPSPEDVRDAEVAVVHSFADLPREVFSWMPRLRHVLSLPAGADHVPFDRIPPGVPVTSTHGPNASAIAEHAFALLLAAAKRVPRDLADLRAGRWAQEERLSKPLAGATLLVLGAGHVGGEVLRLGRAFRMRTEAFRRSARPHPHADLVVEEDGLRGAWARADFAVLALPLTRRTRGIVDAEALRATKPDAVLVNVGRGKLVDRDALARHLDERPSFTYATDVWWRYPKEGEVFDEPLARRENVVGSPHAAALVPGWREEMVAAAAREVRAIAAGEPPAGEDPADYRAAPPGRA